MTIIPAYGRDYTSAKSARADWLAGKDFQIASVGPYCGAYVSVRDVEAIHETITIRYAKQRRGVLVNPS